MDFGSFFDFCMESSILEFLVGDGTKYVLLEDAPDLQHFLRCTKSRPFLVLQLPNVIPTIKRLI
jgi:hypothetical protein